MVYLLCSTRTQVKQKTTTTTKKEEEIIEQFQKLIVKIQCYFYVYFLCVMYKISDLSYNAFYAIWDRKNGAVFMYSNIYVYI